MIRKRLHGAGGLARTCTAIAGSAVLTQNAQSQEVTPGQAPLEEVIVRGYRASLENSLATKRDAIGVVDAISAEDIGKFPDTNLGEALQRVTGMSIDRRNGEGAVVTARGFGPQFNLVSLDGRQIPGADAFGSSVVTNGGITPESRSFNFANVSAAGVSTVEVYKTARADMTTGGIGATINIRSLRPFDHPGVVAAFGVRAFIDDRVAAGDEITPQVSGIFSYASDDQRWGVSLSGDYQRRDSSAYGVSLNDWRIQPWVGGPTNFAANTQAHVYLNNNSTPAVPADDYYDATVINPPFPGQLYGMPNDVRYTFSDRSSERGNAQLTLQFAPSDAWTFTANYAWLDNRLREDRGEQTVWMQNTGFHRIEFDTNEAVATPLVLEEYTGAGKDYSFSQGHRAQRNGLQTYGLNTEWQVSEKFRLTLDLSDAAARSRADDPLTGAGETEMAIAGRLDSSGSCISPATCTNFWTQGFRFDGALPIATRTVYPTSTDAFAGMGGDSNYTFDETSLGTQWLNLYLNEEFVDLRQSRLDGLVEFSKGSFAFGIEMRALEAHVRRAESAMVLGDWSVSDAGNVPGMVSLLEPFGLIGAFEEHRAPGVPTGGWKGNANALASWAIAPLSQGGGGYGDWIQPGAPDGELRRNADYVFDTRIAEDTTAAYVQATWHGEILARRANLRVGLRYENTDVSSTSSLYLPEAPVWVGADIFVQLSSDQLGQVGAEDDYDYFLPSFDFDIALNDSLKARVSYGSTIARASYNNYSPRVALGDFRGSTLNGYRATANGFNPALLPLQSDNLDLSLEWYFADRGYFAVTWWDKHVTNFIGDAVFEEQLYGFRDQSAGPRAQAALAELQRRGLPTDDASLFTMIAMTEHPEGATHPNGTFYPGGAAAFDGSLGQRMAFGLNYDILPTPDDPLRTYNVTRPVNARAANVHGWELGGQYFFGDTGFGVLANYTAVDGDVHYDVTSSPQQNQFALLGLSDSANAVLMYENHGISVRLAWNWRDQFLQQVNYPMHRNPIFVGEYQQFDLGLSYDIGEHLTLSLEGINLTGEDTRWHGRSERQIWSLEDQGARFSIGIQYRL